LDIAIAGGLAITVTTVDVTLTLTQGTSSATNIGSTTAQYAILNVSGAMTAARNLILPSSSRQYVINNNTTGGFALTVKGSATSGVTMVNGEKAHVFWNGSDYAKLSNTPGGAGTFSSITNTGLTSGRVVYSTTGGLETDSVNLTFDGTNLGIGNNASYQFKNSSGTVIPMLTVDSSNNFIYGASGAFTGAHLWYSSGSERMRIDTSGNVGIGTTSPLGRLMAVEGSRANSTNIGNVNVYTNSTAAINLGGTIALGGTFDTAQPTSFAPFGSIRGAKENATNNNYAGYLQFNTIANGDVLTERMRIDSSGNVGIGGTPSGSYKLQVKNSTVYVGVNSDGTNGVIESNGALFVRTNTANPLVFGANTTEAMRIDSSGNVGIGTPTPGAKLDVATTTGFTFGAASTAGVNIGTQGTSGGSFMVQTASLNSSFGSGLAIDGSYSSLKSTVNIKAFGVASGGGYGSNLAFYTSSETTLSEKMRIDSSGNVGIGTDTPLSKFEVRSGYITAGTTTATGGPKILAGYYSSGAITTLGSEYSNGGPVLGYGVWPSTSAAGAFISSTTANLSRGAYTILGNNHVWYGGTAQTVAIDGAVTTSELMRIDSTGNLLVGTPAQIRAGDRFSVSGAGAQVATFSNSTNTSGYSAISTIIQANGNNTSTYHFWGNTSGVGNWYLFGNGTTSYTSDARLKKNIVTTRDGYLEDICRLRVVKYNWKKDNDATPKELGLIAQEVEQIFPNLVQDDLNPIEEGGEIFKQVKHSVLPFMLLKAIQEQQALITSLTARITALEST
jgi:hypothetical protein